MFQGAAALSLDAKGRLAIPSRHRDALAVENGQVVITAHPHGCLIVYPVPAWEPIRDKVLSAPSLDPVSAQLKRLLVGFAQDEALDSAGRVLIAPSLRQFARLEKQVWLVGQGSHFELWSDAGWQKQQEAMMALAGTGLPPGFESLAL
ncbi:cell division/cell wall cluster transcriptional repressor MraZ [Parazoarcus communis]|jgi:MraZ protein|uniref:Transcriptional regulator MraZ n=1 Tax=Parazoarcus communis TaxID=41977 RepID=A0A2U8GUL1_9RHOO|nr:division/cell wall cluster transcriptional repressor MraZ [Parazoarcus communis]AWI76953.1 cell division/cell wall cluster transcriptional repressor MraZ [Parazoarcus communis]AWI79686.1 cell division/cell wall cluster transcriptional repressor MraZ [Parazoarcus communis]PLX73561.1 MAG: cell division/cell wall cluster transcriptional repressor MraZ [Azoarcus sp.]TVT60639.1 MAG: division/cell wall cluster transcriptional repressor MraZ [Azoarcus sp. PHD]|tara:strand:- start:16299 stop:16742 length:444 start_codon:yes stop_codon:yes gene_type:complete